MPFDGYLELGGVEIINVERTQKYVRHMAPHIALPQIERYEGLHIALGDAPYESPALDGAEWVSTDIHEYGGFVGEYSLHTDTATHRFYGMYPLEIQGVGDSTYSAEMTEGVLSGGRTGVGREASRSIRVHGLLIGADPLAAQLGREWLKGVLDAEDCTMHDSACGTSDMRYFLDFPEVCGVWVKGHAGDGVGFSEVNVQNSPLIASSGRLERYDNNPFGYQLMHAGTWKGTRQDGQIAEWGVLDDDGNAIEHHGPMVLQRSNYAKNPTFADDVTNWTPATSTLSRVATGGSDGGSFGRLTETAPPTVYYNWFPDPSFSNTSMEASGWRLTNVAGVSFLGTTGNRTATLTKGAAATMVAEVSLLGPPTPQLSSFTLAYLVASSGLASVTVEVFDNLGVRVFVGNPTTQTFHFQTMSGPNYVIRITTTSASLQIQGLIDVAGSTYQAWFSGSEPSTPPNLEYSYIGAPFISASRRRSGALTSHSLTTLTPDTRYDALTASMYLRSANGASLTLQLVSLDSGAVLGSRVVSVPFQWTRFFVSAPLARNTKLVIAGTGSYDIDQVLIESGTATMDSYFDGSTPAADGYKVFWLGGVNGSTSRWRSIDPPNYENGIYGDGNGNPWNSNEKFVITVDYEGPVLTSYLTMVRGAVPDPSFSWGLGSPVPVEEQIAAVERRYHSVKTTSSLKVLKEYELGQGAYAIEVEFYLGAEVPWAYGPTYQITEDWVGLENFLYSDARDVTTNWATNPGVEGRVAGTSVDLINRVLNPSAEVDVVGYTLLAGGGTAALARFATTTPYGTSVARCVWSAASTALGGGIYYDVAVTAGNIYSFGVGLVQSSIAQTVQLQVDWRTASSALFTYFGQPLTLVAGVSQSVKAEGQVAPATATIARIKIISVAPGVQWSIGSSLMVDGLSCTQTGFLPPYFDGSTVDPSGEFVYSWGGTAHASGTNRSVVLSSTAAAIQGTGLVDCYLSPVTPKQGTYSAKAEWFRTALDKTGGMQNPGGAAAVVANTLYSAALWARTSKAQRLVLSAVFYTSANVLISRVTSAEVVLAATTWTRLTLPSLLAPDGASYAMLEVTTGPTGFIWNAGDWLKVDAVQFTDGLSVPDYFDGASPTDSYAYAWKGTVNASPSTKTLIVAAPPSLFDPTLPALPSPPDAPDVSDIALPDQMDWRRYLVPIPARTVALWASTVPTITLNSKTKEIRQVRIRFMPNPFSLAPDRVDPLYYCGEMIVSYIPPATELVIDGITEGGYATIAGTDSIPADSVLYGTGGFPVSWPEMTCGTDYVMTVDILPTLSVADLDIDLSVSLRE